MLSENNECSLTGVIPAVTELCDLEGIRLGIAGRERAFRDSIDTIGSWKMVLTNYVPVLGSAIVL